MASIPTVVIVGRPNVGKSSLLNRLAGRKVSIVESTPGVTRDRVQTVIGLPQEEIGRPDLPVFAVDTGGYGIVDRDDLSSAVENQIMQAVKVADLILCVTDTQDGITELDKRFAQILRRASGESQRDVEIVLVANKVDDEHWEPTAWNAAQLGLGDPVPVSAQTRHGINGLHAVMREKLHFDDVASLEDGTLEGLRVAIVGKRNSGKSTLVNKLAGSERVIVSEKEGTTRDSVDVRLEMNINKQSRVVTLIDTAGLRRDKSIQGDIEYYAQHRSLRSVRRCDVCLLVLDATARISQLDHKLVNEIRRNHRPTIVVLNKWDLLEKEHTTDEFVSYIDKYLKGLSFAPIAVISAERGRGVKDVMKLAVSLQEQSMMRMATSELNKAVQEALRDNPPHNRGGRQARIYYATQVAQDPPTVRLFVNDEGLFPNNWMQYLDNRLREVTPWAEVPIRIFVDGKQSKELGQRLEEKFRKRREEDEAAGVHNASQDHVEAWDMETDLKIDLDAPATEFVSDEDRALFEGEEKFDWQDE